MINKEIIMNAGGSIKKDFSPDRNIPQYSHKMVEVSCLIPTSLVSASGFIYQVKLGLQDADGTALADLILVSGKTIKIDNVDYIKYSNKLDSTYTQKVGNLTMSLYVYKITETTSNGSTTYTTETVDSWSNFKLYVLKTTSASDNSPIETDEADALTALIANKHIMSLDLSALTTMNLRAESILTNYGPSAYAGWVLVVKTGNNYEIHVPITISSTDTDLILDLASGKSYTYASSTLTEVSLNKSEINTALALKVNNSDIVDNLTTDDATKTLSAKQGKALQDNKVDKEAGKGLSSNDFTDFYKDAINLALHLDSEEDADDVVNRLSEVLKVFENYKEEVNIMSAIENGSTITFKNTTPNTYTSASEVNEAVICFPKYVDLSLIEDIEGISATHSSILSYGFPIYDGDIDKVKPLSSYQGTYYFCDIAKICKVTDSNNNSIDCNILMVTSYISNTFKYAIYSDRDIDGFRGTYRPYGVGALTAKTYIRANTWYIAEVAGNASSDLLYRTYEEWLAKYGVSICGHHNVGNYCGYVYAQINPSSDYVDTLLALLNSSEHKLPTKNKVLDIEKNLYRSIHPNFKIAGIGIRGQQEITINNLLIALGLDTALKPANVVNNLTSGNLVGAPLSAAMGKSLKDDIDELSDSLDTLNDDTLSAVGELQTSLAGKMDSGLLKSKIYDLDESASLTNGEYTAKGSLNLSELTGTLAIADGATNTEDGIMVYLDTTNTVIIGIIDYAMLTNTETDALGIMVMNGQEQAIYMNASLLAQIGSFYPNAVADSWYPAAPTITIDTSKVLAPTILGKILQLGSSITLEDALDEKADASTVNTALASKASTNDINTAIAAIKGSDIPVSGTDSTKLDVALASCGYNPFTQYNDLETKDIDDTGYTYMVCARGAVGTYKMGFNGTTGSGANTEQVVQEIELKDGDIFVIKSYAVTGSAGNYNTDLYYILNGTAGHLYSYEIATADNVPHIRCTNTTAITYRVYKY